MDSITHLTLGAVIGEALLGKKLGKKAMLLGALAQSWPDVDIVASLWLTPIENLLAHRSITHSFLFVILTAAAFSLIAYKWQRQQSVNFKSWMLFFSIQMLVHLFLDAFNAYGIGWFEPFSSLRVSFNTIFVADPLFTLWSAFASIALLALRLDNPIRFRLVSLTLLLSISYLLYCVFNKLKIDGEIKDILKSQQISYQRYFTTPTPLNNWLWYVVAENDYGYYIGYRSVFDTQQAMVFQYFPKQDSLVEHVHDQESLNNLRIFSQGYYTIDRKDEKLVFNDLRFGQIAGWYNPRASFVFNCDLDHLTESSIAIQRGRMAGWNEESIQSLHDRIKGN